MRLCPYLFETVLKTFVLPDFEFLQDLLSALFLVFFQTDLLLERILVVFD